MTVGGSIALGPDFVEAVAREVAHLLQRSPSRSGDRPEPFISVVAAAEHLSCPRSRIYALVHQRAIPHRKDGSRLLFRRSELDAWVDAGGARRA